MITLKVFSMLHFVFFFTLANCKLSRIKTDVGIINGVTEDINVFGQDFRLTKYLGIPYAEPPVGDLRFKKPVPKTTFETEFDAINYGNACLQVDIGLQPEGNITYSEDCLYLNIYAPERQYQNEKNAVMVWFHGGGFNCGSSDIYQGDHLSAYGRVVLVTVNYRLSLWGFLSTADEHSLGNYGLWDQRQALIWIHENIEAFGGDPDRVTLFGESAGAASVIFQGLYPGNKGLFHRLIAQSGSAGSWWASNNQRLQNTEKLSRLAGCDKKSTSGMIACLRSMSGEKLHEIVNKFENGFKGAPLSFIPNFDNDFLKLPATQTFAKDYDLPRQSHEFFMSLDVLGGMNCGEGSLAVSPIFGVDDPENFLPNRIDFVQTIVPALQKLAYPECAADIIKDKIVAEYTNWENPDDRHAIREEFLAMHSDFTFTDPLYRMLDYHATSTGTTYMFYFEDTSSNHLFFNLPWFNKLGHGDEIPFVFGFKNADHVTKWKFYANEWEEQLSEHVIKLWTNFAKTGNPNFPDDLELDWLPYTKKHQHYLQISRGMTSLNVKQRWNTRRANFWTNLLPAVAKSVNCEMNLQDKGTCSKEANCTP